MTLVIGYIKKRIRPFNTDTSFYDSEMKNDTERGVFALYRANFYYSKAVITQN